MKLFYDLLALRPNATDKLMETLHHETATGLRKKSKKKNVFPYYTRSLINPLAPSKIPGKLTSNRKAKMEFNLQYMLQLSGNSFQVVVGCTFSQLIRPVLQCRLIISGLPPILRKRKNCRRVLLARKKPVSLPGIRNLLV